MQNIWFVVIVILSWLGQNDALACQLKPTCTECLTSPGCAWCPDKNFLKPGESNERRCDAAEALKNRKCNNTVNSQPSMTVKKDRKLSNERDQVIQLKPQAIHLKLRIGQPSEFKLEFKRAEGYPIDLYYLMDLSFSMKDDLDKIKTLGQDILRTLEKFTKDKRIGFGSFVDKEALPYVSQLRPRLLNPCPNRLERCQPAFSFRNVLPLTDRADDFTNKVSQQKISGNLDAPEAGLDAIMQSAVCQTEIGWRDVTRILVYTSDDTFHMAGDGRLAGIYKPHDGRCHLDLNSTYESLLQDYPSVGHLAKVLQENNIQLIFAVTDAAFLAYEELSKLIPRSVVGVLKDDSSNVVQLISDAYGNLSSSIVLQHEDVPAGLDISYSSICGGEQESDWSNRGECSGVKLNQQVNFTVRLNATACLAGEHKFKIKVQGISDFLTVTVATICDCDCTDRQEKAPSCSYNGTLHCGMCSCDGGHLGQSCECELTQDLNSMTALLANCRQTNTSDICDGHGRCECGKCTCSGPYRGDFCECDDTACPQHRGKQCNGKGKCNCGRCECDEGYTGEKCHCPRDKQYCKAKGDISVCSGQGQCPCDRCVCNETVTGEYCEKVRDQCSKTFLNCTLCAINERNEQSVDADCKEACEGMHTERLEGQHEFQCTHEGITFDVQVKDGRILIRHADLRKSIDKTYVIIGSSIAGILVIGVVVIIVYRLLVELYDLKEYHSFVRAQQETDWKNVRQLPSSQTHAYITVHVKTLTLLVKVQQCIE
ncbi:hypothetical protein ACEWY4_009392 [Coilia grayii]|uniref:Integrin beta n=1 Tax=Coilia grayii TaxID=363190 RepID=A0ABD1K6C1_9TELE